MSSGKKFSECVWCIHYKVQDTEIPCNTCECDEEKLFAGRPSQFKELTWHPSYSKIEYESLKYLLREYYGKLTLKEEE